MLFTWHIYLAWTARSCCALTNDLAVLQAIQAGSSVKPMLLNPSGGDVGVGRGAWDTGHARMGNYHLWVDASGRLRIKSSTPASDTDGTVVRTQT